MEIQGITYAGSPVDDPEILVGLPEDLLKLLNDMNGFILHHGALHVRGACKAPDWHSLRHAWKGDSAFSVLYASVEQADIPFAQDCVGDQFLLRKGRVFKLAAETGEIEVSAPDLEGFFKEVKRNSERFLSFSPDIRLEPGQLLHVCPPFCTKEASEGVDIRAIAAGEVIAFHAEFARQISDVPDGGKIEFNIVD